MNSTEIGRKAEAAARVYLGMRGYEIIEHNWRRPRCEIDIIAQKDGVIYFTEVKYRHHDDQGSGLEAVTKTKLKQMQYAANTWVEEHKWSGQFCLAAVEIAGDKFVVMGFIDNVY